MEKNKNQKMPIQKQSMAVVHNKHLKNKETIINNDTPDVSIANALTRFSNDGTIAHTPS